MRGVVARLAVDDYRFGHGLGDHLVNPLLDSAYVEQYPRHVGNKAISLALGINILGEKSCWAYWGQPKQVRKILATGIDRAEKS